MPRNIGPADHLTEAQVAELAEITLSDIQSAALAWRQDAPPAHRLRLDAVAESTQRSEPTDA